MRREDAHGLGDLLAEAAGGVAAQAREVHAGIAGRVFGLLGAQATPARVIHDQVSAAAYAGATVLAAGVVRGGSRVYGLARSPQEPSLEQTSGGRLVLGAINGAWGDRLERRGNRLASRMTIHRHGRAAGVSPRLVIFIHGLCETEDAWRLHAERHPPYGDRLERELGRAALYVRYNTGLHISDNGRRLSALLEELVDAWPVPVAEIALVGHSMGGLVARSACHYGAGTSWRERLRQVFMLACPHKGAPLELAANAACHALSRLPETRGFAKPLKARSAGIKDLGYGYVVEEDWLGHDPDAFWNDTGTEVPFIDSAEHFFVSATVTRDPHAPAGRLLGDLLVLRASAWSQEHTRERVRFDPSQYLHVGPANHLDVLNHPVVYEQLRRWMTRRPALPAARAASSRPRTQTQPGQRP